jgi:hypothetical protein
MNPRPTRVRSQLLVSSAAGVALAWSLTVAISIGLPLGDHWTAVAKVSPSRLLPMQRKWAPRSDAVYSITEQHWAGRRDAAIFIAQPASRINPRQEAAPGAPYVFVARSSYGFPCRHTWGDFVRIQNKRGYETYEYDGLYERARPFRGAVPYDWEHYAVPWRPHLLGQVVNTAFYGAAFWFVWFAPRYVRRMRRLRAGECILCGYPTKRGSVCTECGTVAHGVVWRSNA